MASDKMRSFIFCPRVYFMVLFCLFFFLFQSILNYLQVLFWVCLFLFWFSICFHKGTGSFNPTRELQLKQTD